MEKLLSNMAYFTTSHDVAKLTLIDGTRTAWYGDLDLYSVIYEGHYVLGDFNRDGLGDAAVVIGENGGGNHFNYLLAFLINDGTKLVHRKSAYLGYSAIIDSVKERAGKVVVNFFVLQEGDCMAGPTKRVKKIFDYRELGPRTRVPVAKGDRFPSEADLRYVSRNQEVQSIYDTHIPGQIRKVFDLEAHVSGNAYPNIFRKKFIVLEEAPTAAGGIQVVVIFKGFRHPYWVLFDEVENQYFLRSIRKLSKPLSEMLVGRIKSCSYERFWQ